MKIVNDIPDMFSDKHLLNISEWVRTQLGNPVVKGIIFNYEAKDFEWDGYAWFASRKIRVSLGKKQGAMCYEKDGYTIDPCGKHEIAIVAITHEMQHIKQQSENHETIYPEVVRLLKLWRKEHGKKKKIVRRFLFLVTEIRKRI